MDISEYDAMREIKKLLEDSLKNEDLSNEDLCDSGEFDSKYSQYRTGGDLNNIQLYIAE